MNLSVWSLKTVTYTDEFRKTDITLCSLGNIPTLPPCLVSVERERNKKAGWKSWNVAKAVVGDRECWSENVSALCAYWCGET